MDDLHLNINNRCEYLEQKVIELELKLRIKENIIKGLEDENRILIADKKHIHLLYKNRDYLLEEKNKKILELEKDIDDLIQIKRDLEETLENLERGFFL